jgi:hypothetical protein
MFWERTRCWKWWSRHYLLGGTMSFKWNYIRQFSMLFGVFCQVTWHMVCKICFCCCLGIQVGLLRMQLHHPFVGFRDCTIPSYEPFKTMAHPLAQPIVHYPKREKKHTHTHMSKWCSNFVTLWLMVREERKKSITSRDQVQLHLS